MRSIVLALGVASVLRAQQSAGSPSMAQPPALPAVVQQTRQMLLSTSASSQTAAAGDRIELLIDIELKPKMHVYAPGIENYIAIDWQIEPTELARIGEATWPKPEILHLDVINETVPVYKNKIHVERELVFASTAKLKTAAGRAGQIAIKGILRYQACDDRMCYVPASVPVQWTFAYPVAERQKP